MKDRIILNIVRGKSFISIFHNGEVIAKLEVADRNVTNRVSVKFHSNKEFTYVKVEKDVDEYRFNREVFNV
jgi:hypothetical protein